MHIDGRIQETRMYLYPTARLVSVSTLLLLAAVLTTPNAYAEDPTEVAAAVIDEKYSEHNLDVKKLFATRCSWCHQGYGMVQADGPKLAGTSSSRDKIIEVITKGKTPMPGFRKQLKPWRIEALADYILELPSD